MCFWVTPLLSMAQGQATQKAGTISLQVQQVDFSAFNAQGLELGYQPLSDVIMEFGGGMTHIDKRWKTTILFTLGFMDETTPQATAETRYEYIGLALGTAFNLLKPDGNWFLGPEVTVMPQASQVILTNTPPANGLAGAATADFVKLTRLSSSADLGLNGHRLIRYGPEQKAVLLTLRGGYRLDGEEDSWRVDQGLLLRNTGIVAGGWYGSVQISFLN